MAEKATDPQARDLACLVEELCARLNGAFGYGGEVEEIASQRAETAVANNSDPSGSWRR